MKKWMKLGLLWLLVLAFATGCSLIYKDPEVDKQTVVLEVNGKTFLKGDVKQMIDAELDYQLEAYAYQYGTTLDRNDPELTAYVEDMVLEMLVQQAVVDQKLEEGGYSVATEEEKQTAQKNVDELYATYIDEIVTYDLADSELPEEEKRAAAEGMMEELGYASKEAMLADELLSIADEKLFQSVVGDVTLSEDELKAAYEARVEMAKADYEADPSYYESDVSGDAVIYYRPEGYRYVKQIFIPIAQEDQEAIQAMDDQIFADYEALSALQEEFAAAESEEERNRLLEEHNAAEDALAAAEEALTQRTESAYIALQPVVEQIQAALAVGETFDALAEQYGAEPVEEFGVLTEEGYLIGEASTAYSEDFQLAAMALEKAGDVSEPVRSEYGIHIIVYAGDVPAGAVALAEVRESLAAEALSEKQSTAFQNTLAAWVEEADVKIYKNRLAD